MAGKRNLYGVFAWLLIVLRAPASESFNNSIELRHGVLFKKINDVQFVDEQYSFYVRIKFKKFIRMGDQIPVISSYINDEDLLQDVKLITEKLNATIEKLFFFVYSNFEPEKINIRKDDIYTFEYTSEKNEVIDKLFIRLETIIESSKCTEINGSRINKGTCASEFDHIILLLKTALFDFEMEILTFMVMLTQTINSKVLSDYIVPKDEMTNIVQSLISKPFYNSFVTNPTSDNIFQIYNLCKVLNISYNTQDYSLLLRINFPLQHSHYQYMIYEVIPLYTPSKNNGSYSVRLDAWWSNSKYLAIAYDLSNFMTFSDYSCRYVKILNNVICKDYFEHMRNDVDYCVFSLYMDRPSKYCRYLFAPKPTREFINLENGVWFYSYNLDKTLRIRQFCSNKIRDRKNKNTLSLNPNGTGIFMFDVHCHGSLADNSYEFMSIDRDNKTGGFKNINVDIQTSLLAPTPPPSIKSNDDNSEGPVTNKILFSLTLVINILWIIAIACFIIVYVMKKKRRLETRPTNQSSLPLNNKVQINGGAGCRPTPPPPLLQGVPILRPTILPTTPQQQQQPLLPPPQLPPSSSSTTPTTTNTTPTSTTPPTMMMMMNPSIPTTPPPPIPNKNDSQEPSPIFFGDNVVYEVMDGYLTMKS